MGSATRILALLSLLTSFGCSSVKELSPVGHLERSLIYQPSAYPPSFPDAKVPFENVEFSSADGTRLHGWFADHPDPVGVALFCHGNAGNIISRGETLMILNQRHRLAVMVFDYRGFGKSEGKPSESGVLADARAARA